MKFKIFDFHYPDIPFCNFQNSVSEKIWCCLTYVCVYISRRQILRIFNRFKIIALLNIQKAYI